MPGKKKKGSKSNAASDSRPPLGGHNDSLRADIAAAQQQQQQHDNPFANDADADDGDDLAAQLLASLDARDEAQAQEQAKEPPPPPPPQEKEQHTSPSKVLSGLKEVGDKILHPSSSSSASSPPPLTLTNDQSQQQPRKIGRQKLRKRTGADPYSLSYVPTSTYQDCYHDQFTDPACSTILFLIHRHSTTHSIEIKCHHYHYHYHLRIWSIHESSPSPRSATAQMQPQPQPISPAPMHRRLMAKLLDPIRYRHRNRHPHDELRPSLPIFGHNRKRTQSDPRLHQCENANRRLSTLTHNHNHNHNAAADEPLSVNGMNDTLGFVFQPTPPSTTATSIITPAPPPPPPSTSSRLRLYRSVLKLSKRPIRTHTDHRIHADNDNHYDDSLHAHDLARRRQKQPTTTTNTGTRPSTAIPLDRNSTRTRHRRGRSADDLNNRSIDTLFSLDQYLNTHVDSNLFINRHAHRAGSGLDSQLFINCHIPPADFDLDPQLFINPSQRYTHRADSGLDSNLFINRHTHRADSDYGPRRGMGTARHSAHLQPLRTLLRRSGPIAQRKEAEQAADRARYEEELKANGGNIDEAEVERSRIFSICSSLGVEMHEINPDGHCLYSAISDQYTLLTGQKRTYQDLRRQTSEYMKSNKDDFLPFISDFDEKLAGINNNSSSTDNYIRYCDAIQNTAVWGGQPEILAMSRFLSIPIWIIQADEPTILKINEEQSKEGKLLISYHRKMYGLGEHYNSLRNKSG
ncbi:unnamed protein product [Sympodiomycopsis kandeliae]